jgi:pimeloyl-ACP methyl ester carboxylesterase
MKASRRALLLPGRAYTAKMPLLALTDRALSAHGWRVSAVSWTVPEVPPDVHRWVRDRAAAVVERKPAERWLFAAKSMGTHIVHADDLRADAYVLLTPLLVEPEAVEAVGRLVSGGVPVLLVGGTRDQFWSSAGARATGAQVLEIPGAGHSLTAGDDDVRTAEIRAEIARAVDGFLSALG